jgi:superfamily II helicase
VDIESMGYGGRKLKQYNRMIFQKLLDLGYKKAGNWYMCNNCSVNLFTREIKSTNSRVSLSYTFDKSVDIDKVEQIRLFLDSLE